MLQQHPPHVTATPGAAPLQVQLSACELPTLQGELLKDTSPSTSIALVNFSALVLMPQSSSPYTKGEVSP